MAFAQLLAVILKDGLPWRNYNQDKKVLIKVPISRHYLNNHRKKFVSSLWNIILTISPDIIWQLIPRMTKFVIFVGKTFEILKVE